MTLNVPISSVELCFFYSMWEKSRPSFSTQLLTEYQSGHRSYKTMRGELFWLLLIIIVLIIFPCPSVIAPFPKNECDCKLFQVPSMTKTTITSKLCAQAPISFVIVNDILYGVENATFEYKNKIKTYCMTYKKCAVETVFLKSTYPY